MNDKIEDENINNVLNNFTNQHTQIQLIANNVAQQAKLGQLAALAVIVVNTRGELGFTVHTAPELSPQLIVGALELSDNLRRQLFLPKKPSSIIPARRV